MALGRSTGQLFIVEGRLKLGYVTDPQRIGTDLVSPASRVTILGDLGYTQQGGTAIPMTRSYAEALSGTPAILIGKRMIRKQFMFNFKIFQLNVSLYKLIFGMLTQEGYTTTSPSLEIRNLAWIGPDEPTQYLYCWIHETVLENGWKMTTYMWAGKCVAENVQLPFTGNAYGTCDVTATAFPHPAFDDVVFGDQKSYGLIDTVISTASGSLLATSI